MGFFSRRKPVVIQHPLNHELYQYTLGYRFDPGAMGETFDPLFQLPPIMFRGSARLAGSLNKFQQPQVWFHQQNGVNGMGGVQSGQLIGQPLLDPSQFEGA